MICQDEIIWVGTNEALSEAIEKLLLSEAVAIDTEYDSFRYFREKLCLIQMWASRSCFLFDPLSPLDLAPLGELFSNPSILKIFHAGENDIRLLKRDYSFSVVNIFDTAKAAALLGEEHLSLEHLVVKYLGVMFEKKRKIQRSRWDRRPLTAKQLAYASLDVKYLYDLYRVLREKLSARNLLGAAEEAFEGVAHTVWCGRIFNHRGYKKILNRHVFSPEEQEKLKAIYEWRHSVAEKLNQAPFMILTDDELAQVVQEGVSTLDPKKEKRWGKEIREIFFREGDYGADIPR